MSEPDSNLGQGRKTIRMFETNGPLFPLTRQKIDNLRVDLVQKQLTPWLFIRSQGVRVADFHGKRISIGPCEFDNSEWLVFWKSVEPFLENAIVQFLNETLEMCRTRNYQPEPHLRETAMLLRGHLIDPIYSEMARIERRLLGKGSAKSRRLRDVTDEIDHMVQILKQRMNEFIEGVNAEAILAASGTTSTLPPTPAESVPFGKDHPQIHGAVAIQAPSAQPAEGKSRKQHSVPTEIEKKIATYYAESGRTEAEVATYLNSSLKKELSEGKRPLYPLSQEKVSRIIKKVNRWRRSIGLAPIPTRKHKGTVAIDPAKIEMGERTHKGQGLRSAGTRQARDE